MKRLVEVEMSRAELLASLDDDQFAAVVEAFYEAVRNTLDAERQLATFLAEWGAVPTEAIT